MAWLYWRSLGAATLSLLIADEMRLTLSQKRDLFWAGLAHDLGMLHVDPAILIKQVKLAADDWYQIQRHVPIGVELMQLDPETTEPMLHAVREHHERCDGTGYPDAKVESELSLEGQVLALADSVVAIYCNRYRDKGTGWQDVIPVIEMNEQQFLFRSINILNAIVQRSHLPVGRVVSGGKLHDFLADFLDKCERMKLWFGALQEALMKVGFTHGDKRLHAMQNVLLHLATAQKHAEMCKPEILELVAQLLQQGAVELPKAVGDACIQQQEMSYHLLRLSRMLEKYLSEGGCVDATINRALQQGFDSVKTFVTA